MKIACFDIETTDLKAMTGHLLCASFCDVITNETKSFRLDSSLYRNPADIIDDTALAEALRDELNNYNMIVTWNGKMFDVPFLNARLIKEGRRTFIPQFHLDLMYYAGGVSLRIGSRKLLNVEKFLSTRNTKTAITWDDWQRAANLDKAAMDTVVDHCEQDVKVLAETYWKLLPLVAQIHR